MKYLLIAMLFLAGCRNINHYIPESLKDTSDSSCVQIRMYQSEHFSVFNSYFLQYKFPWHETWHGFKQEMYSPGSGTRWGLPESYLSNILSYDNLDTAKSMANYFLEDGRRVGLFIRQQELLHEQHVAELTPPKPVLLDTILTCKP